MHLVLIGQESQNILQITTTYYRHRAIDWTNILWTLTWFPHVWPEEIWLEYCSNYKCGGATANQGAGEFLWSKSNFPSRIAIRHHNHRKEANQPQFRLHQIQFLHLRTSPIWMVLPNFRGRNCWAPGRNMQLEHNELKHLHLARLMIVGARI